MDADTVMQLQQLARALDEKIASPSTKKGKAAYVKSLTKWASAAAKVAKSYNDKLGDVEGMDGSTSGATIVANLDKLLTSISAQLTQAAEAAAKIK